MEAKDRILQKAADLYMRYGIRSVTMDEIANQLGISKKTIYQFFTDKDEMVEAIVDQVIMSNEEECRRFKDNSENALHEVFIALEELEEMLKAMNPLIMYDLEKHHPRAFKKFRDHKYLFMYKMVKENLERGIREELYRPEMDIDVVSKSRIEIVFMSFNQDIFPHNRYRIAEVSYELSSLFMNGITTAKGRKFIEKYSQERSKNKQRLYE